jgi:hypothetical protein
MQSKPDILIKPWQREPMVWMLIAIPASSVLVGMVMLWFAITSYDGLVVDDYHQQGKEINRLLARTTVAVEHGISAELELLPRLGILNLRLSMLKELPLNDTLPLSFIHRTMPGEDISITLHKNSNGVYVGHLPELKPSNWIIHLDARDWRITGQVPIPGHNLIRLAAS